MQIGIGSIVGLKSDDLDKDSPTREVIDKNSSLGKLINGDTDENITTSRARNVPSLTIDVSSGITNLEEFYKLTSLKELTLTNFKKDSNFSLSGLENAISLNYLCFKSCDLSSYDTMKYLKSLQYLYLEDSCDDEVTNLFTAMKGVDYDKLEYLGIFGMAYPYVLSNMNLFQYYDGSYYSNVSDISILNELSIDTKKSVKYLYLNNNKLTNVDCLEDFSNVRSLFLTCNNISSIELACKNMTSLIYFNGCINSLKNINGLVSNVLEMCALSNNDLDDISVLPCEIMAWLDLSGNTNLKNVSAISKCSKLTVLYISSCPNLNHEDVKSFAKIYNSILDRFKSIDSDFLIDLETDDLKNLSDKGYSDDDIKSLINNSYITKLSLSNNTGLGNTDISSLSIEEQANIRNRLGEDANGNDLYLRYILSTMENMEYLALRNITNLENIDFVRFMPNLVELDLRGTFVEDLSVLETLTDSDGLKQFASLAISNTNTNLTLIQNTINNFYNRSGQYWTNIGDAAKNGLKISSEIFISKLNLCESIKYLKLCTWDVLTDLEDEEVFDLSGMESLEKVNFWHVNKAVKLPNSVTYMNGLHSEFPIFESVSRVGTIYISSCSETTQAGFTNLLNSLEGCSTLKTLEISWVYNIFSFEGVSSLDGSCIDRISISFGYESEKDIDISDLANFNNETGKIKNLRIQYGIIKDLPDLSGLKLESLTINGTSIENIDGLKDCTTLTELDLSGNKIQNLDSIKNLSNLKTLNLSANNIYNTYKDPVKNETINNLKILSDLHGKGLQSLYVSNNHFEETENSEDLLKKLKELFGSNGDFSNQI